MLSGTPAIDEVGPGHALPKVHPRAAVARLVSLPLEAPAVPLLRATLDGAPNEGLVYLPLGTVVTPAPARAGTITSGRHLVVAADRLVDVVVVVVVLQRRRRSWCKHLKELYHNVVVDELLKVGGRPRCCAQLCAPWLQNFARHRKLKKPA